MCTFAYAGVHMRVQVHVHMSRYAIVPHGPSADVRYCVVKSVEHVSKTYTASTTDE